MAINRVKKLTNAAYSPTNPASESAIRTQIDDSIQEVSDLLLLTTDGSSGGDNIGMTPITALGSASTVQSQIEKIVELGVGTLPGNDTILDSMLKQTGDNIFPNFNKHLINYEQLILNLRYPWNNLNGVTSSGDQTSVIQTIINSIPSGVGANLFLSDIEITVSGDITFPDYVSLIGKNATIKFGGSLTFGKNATINGIIFDGNLSCGKIIISGDYSIANNCSFKNIKSSVPGTTVALSITSSTGIEVFNNLFDTIQPYSENAIVGDANGSSTAVWSNSSDCFIHHNTFKNISGYEDGDCILIQNASIASSIWPFNVAGDIVGYKWDKKDVLIESNVFYIDNKSGIKIQGSGAKVKNNVFNLSYSEDPTTGCVRVQSSEDVEIESNKFISSTVKSPQIIFLSACRNIAVKSNILQMVVASTSTSKSIINLSNLENVIFQNNIIYNQNVDRIITYSNLRTFNFIDNYINVSGSGDKYLFWCPNGNTLENTNLNVLRNTLESSLWFYFQYTFITAGVIENNTFNAPLTIYLNSCKNIRITRNRFTKGTDTHAIFIRDQQSVTTTTFEISNNIFSGSYARHIYADIPVLSVKVINNSFLVGTTLFTWNGSQVLSEVLYIPGNNVLNFDYGTKANRPTSYTLEEGHLYFCTDLNKPIWKYGASWYYSDGTVVS